MPKDVPLDSFGSAADAAEPSAEEPDEETAAETATTDEATTETPTAETAASEDAASTATESESSSVEPATSTYAWSPDGGECAACRDAVERRWRDDGDLVCADCKSW